MMTRVAEQPMMYTSQMQQYYQFPSNQCNSLPPPNLSQPQFTIPNQSNFSQIPSLQIANQNQNSSISQSLSPNSSNNDFTPQSNITQTPIQNQSTQQSSNPNNSQTSLNSPIQPSQQSNLLSQYQQQNGLLYYAYNQYPGQSSTPPFQATEFYTQQNGNNSQQNLMNSMNQQQVSMDNSKFNMNGLFPNTTATGLPSSLQFNNNGLLDIKNELSTQAIPNNFNIDGSSMNSFNSNLSNNMVHPRSLTYSGGDRHLSLPLTQPLSMNSNLLNNKDEYMISQKRYKKRRNTEGGYTTINDMTPETAARNRCPRCQKQFKRPSSLQTHLYSHTGEKPFSCTWDNCGRLFSVKSNMTRHMKLHERDAKLNKVHDHDIHEHHQDNLL